MLKLNTEKGLQLILLFALLNSSIFIATSSSGFLRLIVAMLMNISGILLIIYFFKKIRKNINTAFYFKVVFFLLIVWSSYTILRSISLDSKSLITLFGHYLMAWAWLTPLAIVFGFNISNWLKSFDFFCKLLFIGSILALGSYFYSLDTVYGIIEWMAFLPFLLLTHIYQNKRNKKIIVFSIFSYIFLTYVGAQRANILFLTLLFLFPYFYYLRNKQTNNVKKGVIYFGTFILIIIVAIQFQNITYKVLENKELTTDTRSFLFLEIFSDLSHEEEVFGRGALGKYYSPHFAYTEKNGLPGDSPMRSVSEVGYLQMILKGGYVMMILYLLILLPAAYLGIFKSNNIIAKMSGYLILSYLVLWGVSYYPVYSAEYILLWMATGTAISKSARKMKNQDLIIKTKGRLVFVK